MPKPEVKSPRWFVYVIETVSGRLYSGITTDLDRRFQEHSGGKKGAKFFRLSKPKKVLAFMACLNRSEAQRMEARIKKLTKREKRKIIMNMESLR